MITLYGKPQIASDSEKPIINDYTKKVSVVHSATYYGWINDILKQLNQKYVFLIDKPTNVTYTFYLPKKETPKRLLECCNDISKCLIQRKVFKGCAVIIPKIKQIITGEKSKVEIEL